MVKMTKKLISKNQQFLFLIFLCFLSDSAFNFGITILDLHVKNNVDSKNVII